MPSTVSPYRWWILLGLWASAVMEVLDTTIVNVSLPQMAGNLNATTQEIAWVATGYILSNVVVLPMTAFLAGRFGRRNYLIASIVLFIVASFFCGTSTTLGQMILFRILQGAGGAALLSTAQATLREIFPPQEQGLVQAIFLIGIVVAPTVGPTLGGWITDNYNWNWIFYINIPLGLLALLPVTAFLEDSPFGRGKRPADWLGIGLLTVGLGCLQYVLEEGNKDDWFQSELIVKLTAIGTIALVALVFWQLSPKNTAPVVDFKVLQNQQLRATLVLFLVLGFGLYGGIFLYPLFTQLVLGLTPTASGLSLMPGGFATMVSALICGRLQGKADPRVLIWIGMILFCFSMWNLGHLSTLIATDSLTFTLVIRGFGLGFLFTPINQIAFSVLKPQEVQQAAGLISLTRQLGGSLGIAILGTYLTNQTRFHQAMLSESLHAGNAALAERQSAIAANLVAHGMSPVLAKGAALGGIARQVGLQAQTMGFNDGFFLILLSFAAAAPIVLRFKRPVPAQIGRGGGGGGH